jgi:hypothetical protein
MRILELGNYVVPAYAGMILAEQGHQVVKWVNGRDPILALNSGDALWRWINHGKQLEERHPKLLALDWADVFEPSEAPEIVLDNFRPATLESWQIDPARIAARWAIRWVSMRDELHDHSFDVIAQARSWLELGPWCPFWAGDTIGGLWLAFKALAAREAGHFTLGQASCMQKMIEGELMVDRPPANGSIPWETEAYRVEAGEAVVAYKGKTYREPIRDRAWKLEHLWHQDGRITI